MRFSEVKAKRDFTHRVEVSRLREFANFSSVCDYQMGPFSSTVIIRFPAAGWIDIGGLEVRRSLYAQSFLTSEPFSLSRVPQKVTQTRSHTLTSPILHTLHFYTADIVQLGTRQIHAYVQRCYAPVALCAFSDGARKSSGLGDMSVDYAPAVDCSFLHCVLSEGAAIDLSVKAHEHVVKLFLASCSIKTCPGENVLSSLSSQPPSSVPAQLVSLPCFHLLSTPTHAHTLNALASSVDHPAGSALPRT
ncbi:hypothetical protein Hypma_015007 [Hypsizygus marmoreus]|uniref:Uncharacterized protein n=1 Tax=Hypsizygus marmoreus TaxID=39966 RepID=A0A369K668_HYPMA|nr:hypothetical protein Hypma_015007 [Hypsizygus marmoreus]